MEMFWISSPSGLAYRILATGRGPAAVAGDRVTIHETLSLSDGRVIHSTRTAGSPITVTLGAHQVIPGVEEGLGGMRLGERRRLLVPPLLDGRSLDPAVLPPTGVRVYDIEILAIQSSR
jgi:FKBP-type peptidyl-prolyl cis-trans isomerase